MAIDANQFNSNLDISLTLAGNILSVATNAVTTMMIAYRLWYVAVSDIRWIQWLTMNRYRRSHRRLTVKTLGLSKRKSPVQTTLLLLIESGLVYLIIQVSVLLADMCAQDPQSFHRSDR